MKKLFLKQAIFIIFLSLGAGCKKESVNAQPPPPPPPPKETLQGVSPFFVVAAIAPTLLQNNSPYRNILVNELNSITTENALH